MAVGHKGQRAENAACSGFVTTVPLQKAELLTLAARIDDSSSKKVVSFFIRMHNEPLSVAMRVNDADFRDQARDAMGQRPVVPL
jgi:hypothetical protein